MELVSDVLGFTAKSTTKKSEVGAYFNILGVKLAEGSEELELVAKKVGIDVDKSDSSKSPIREAGVDSAKEVLTILKGHLESLRQVGDANLVGYASSVGANAGQQQIKLN